MPSGDSFPIQHLPFSIGASQNGHKDAFPLSFVQEAIICKDGFIHLSTGSNLTAPLYLTGALDISKLQLALNDLVKRHQVLRTKIISDREGLHQVVQSRELCLTTLYLCHHNNLDLVLESTQYHFAIDKELPIKAHYFSQSPDEHLLLLVFSRLAVDGTSVRRITEELWELYEAHLEGRAPALHPVSFEYVDYVLWQRSLAMANENKSYFNQCFPDDSTTHAVRPARQMNEAPQSLSVAMISLNPCLHKRLLLAAKDNKVSLKTILVAAIALVLFRISNKGRFFLFGSNGSDHTSWRGYSVGCYDAATPLQINITLPTTVPKLIANIQQAQDESLLRPIPYSPSSSDWISTTTLDGFIDHLSAFVSLRDDHDEKILKRRELSLQRRSAPLCKGSFNLVVDFIEALGANGVPSGIDGRIEYDSNKIKYAGMVHLLQVLNDILANQIPAKSSVDIDTSPISLKAINEVPASNRRITNSLRYYVGPGNPTQNRLIRMWESLLNLHRISIYDRFLDLGGSHLLLARFVEDLITHYGLHLNLDVTPISDDIMVHDLSLLLVNTFVTERIQVIKQQSFSDIPPLFFLHGDVDGGGLYLIELAKLLSYGQALIALHPHGTIDDVVPDSVEQMAQAYIEDMLRAQSTGPFFIVGYCNAGLVAFEIARRLKMMGHGVHFLGLIATQYKSGPASGSLNPDLQKYRKFAKQPGLSLFGRHMLAAYQFLPQQYEGTITIFWPAEDNQVEPIGAHWGKVAVSVNCQNIIGTHHSCIADHVDSLGKQLNRLLGEAIKSSLLLS